MAAAWRIVRKRAIREAARNPAKKPIPFGARPPKDKRAHAYGYGRNRIRLHDGKFPFLAVVEKTEAGWPHLHILARAKWIDWAWLRAQMHALLDSPQVRVKRLRARDVRTSYCVKYCGKATHKFASAKRYWQSRDYDRQWAARRAKEPVEHYRWEKRRAPLRWIVSAWLQRGWLVTFESPYRATAEPREARWCG